ncbi:CoA transferase [Pseudofrankia sp. BMG5.36]|uniref:CaiB/BaiF CoA transferase family protein n=1 Tax=Pseudofrankia sp. BMG5.36 TaxID=1834512 RepID=UPI0008D960DE|nr:CoA transferase [Pseudofrankia sp. BMG5.36]OHV56477.1 carnitine dehydratase [Pseudofrankia sp. BMG5.36]
MWREADAAPGRTPYNGLVVVEVGTDLDGEQTGKLLADLGATVIKVEPPGGSPTRACGPWLGDVEGSETSLAFATYNTSKQSVVLDLPAGLPRLEELVADADVLLCGLQPAALARLGLSYGELVARHPRLVVLSVTPFGLTGPWADYLSSDLVALAAGGPLASCGYDDHTIPPIRPGGNQGFQTSASHAHNGLLLALLQRRRTGRGQIVDVSMHDALAVTGELANPYWFYPRVLLERQTCRHAQPEPTQPALFQCADGNYIYFALVLADQKPWQQLVAWLDSAGVALDLTDPAYGSLPHRQENFAHIQDLIEVFCLLHDADWMYHEGQARGLPIGIVSAPEDLLADAHLRARGYFVGVDLGEAGTVEYPSTPFRFGAFPVPPMRRPPRLGEHTAARLQEP